ncbi:hypothetical protein TanjilG_08809 [Lupinus angustifolius]|uniref:Integrase catalytic domain-containing protein n=1 Tax=Lupinus angustifolius TaxID=3871 RepID=A0A4P1RP80_LUPAN|nr:hypothetical protein TanjilG_08809 [Lupinus angustifolius]
MSCPYTTSQNGRAEHKHRHITETSLTMLFHSQVSTSFWVEAFSTAVYTINRLPSLVLVGKSPFEVLFGALPNYENFHPFGCRVFPCLRDYVTNKFLPRSAPCIFLGYSANHKGFRCFNPASSRMYITRHAQFDEQFFPYAKTQSTTDISVLNYSNFWESITPILSSSLGPNAHKSPVAHPTPTVDPSIGSSQPDLYGFCLDDVGKSNSVIED